MYKNVIANINKNITKTKNTQSPNKQKANSKMIDYNLTLLPIT